MKKLLILLILVFSLVSCTTSDVDTDTDNTEDATVVLTGTSTLTWHYNETFNCVVRVTLKGNVIESVEIVEGSYISTGSDTFRLWDENKDEYLASYIGKTVEEINALEANDPTDVTNHYDGGSMSGVVEAISGATASSTVVAKAIKDAVKDAISEVS